MSLFSEVFLKSPDSKSFDIENDSDFYFVVKLKKSVILYTKKKEQAEQLISELEKMLDWRKIKSLEHLKELYPDSYEKIRPILRTYAVPKKFNGNYLITLASDGLVKYKLSNGLIVEGKNLVEGVAIRGEQGSYHLDNVFSGKTITTMGSEQHLLQLYNETKCNFPWHSDKVIDAIGTEPEIRLYLTNVKEAIVAHTTLPKPDLSSLCRFQFKVNGGTDPVKLDAYVSAMSKINNMVGLENVKSKINEFIKGISATKRLSAMNLDVTGDALHSLFVGPPGTGKTEVARIMSDLLWSLDLLKERKLVELSKEDFVSSNIGGTEEITKEKINQALGGVLFVDEAYMLKGFGSNNAQTGQDFGKIALDIIMRAMENRRGDELVVIFAGYPKEIDELLNENPGLRSRFALTYRFDQYTPLELAQIADRMLSSKGFITSQIKDNLFQLVSKKAKEGSLQGNARDVRVLTEEIIRKHKVRIVDQSGNLTIIHPDDVKSLINKNRFKESEGLKQLKDDAIKELNTLIGLGNIKEEINTWTNYVAIEKLRFDKEIITEAPKLHMSFEGAPGVGKTTVARIVGKILKGNGMLSSGHFVEILGKDLVAGYMGQTAAKVKDIVKSALGGILFIDEAYSIVKGKDDMFGREAVDTLIAEMENIDGDFVVILAGYPKEIEELFQTNPGFESRVAQRFVFKDYNTTELVELFKLECNKNSFTFDIGALEAASTLISKAKSANEVKGNGRWIRNFIVKIKMAQANRLVTENAKDLQLLTASDIQNGFKKM